MMGKHQSEAELFSYRINLHQRVRSDHPLRKVLQAIDFEFVRDEVAAFYGRNGNVSIDPVVLVKLMFLLFFENIASERKLMAMLPERLDYLFFLGYGLEDTIPNHSVLSKARKKWGNEVFKRLFVRTVLQCVKAGLVDGGKLHMDSSLQDANASRDSVVKASPELIEAIQQVYATEQQKLEEVCQPATPAKPKGSPARTNATHVSLTDPDARLSKKAGSRSCPRFKHHRGVDDAHGVITAVEVTAADVDDATRLESLHTQHQEVTGTRAHTVVADRKYGTKENFIRCQELGIAAHMGDLGATQKPVQAREGMFEESAFIYEPQTDSFRCPAGQQLGARCFIQATQSYLYTTDKDVCPGCPFRDRCTTSKRGRTLRRHAKQELLDAGRKQSSSKEARKDRARRMHLMEGSFADASNNHGFKRVRWRGMGNVLIGNHLIAACQNVRILLARPRKPEAPAALGKIVTFEFRTLLESVLATIFPGNCVGKLSILPSPALRLCPFAP